MRRSGKGGVLVFVAAGTSASIAAVAFFSGSAFLSALAGIAGVALVVGTAAWNGRTRSGAAVGAAVRGEPYASMAHEIRTPVTAIYGYTRVLLTDFAASIPPPARDLLAVVDRNARRLKILVEQTLDVNLVEAGSLTLERSMCDLSAVVRESVDEARADAERRGVGLSFAGDESAPPVFVDADRMHQALYNLLRNALRFAPEGSTVQVELTHGERGFAIAVSDAGPGIPAELREKVFERFYRAPGQPAHSGVGLGLAIVKGIVLAHGGEVSVDRSEAGGARFLVRLPAPSPVPTRGL